MNGRKKVEFLLKLTAGLAMSFLVVGCGRPAESELEYSESDKASVSGRAPRHIPPGQGEDAAITLVKTHPAAEGEGTTEEWIRRELNKAEGQVLFPRWEAKRHGATKYEVRFTYTVLGDDYTIEKKGYSWPVDLLLKLVGASSILRQEDLAGRSRGQRLRRRRKELNRSLE